MDQVLLKLIAVVLDVIVFSLCDRCMGCHMIQFDMVHIQHGMVAHNSGNYSELDTIRSCIVSFSVGGQGQLS